MTAWHHLACVVPHCNTAADIEGYDDLPEEQQQVLQERVDESRGQVDELYQPINPDDLIRKAWDKKAPQPPELLSPLLPYQLEGLGWLLHQELEEEHRGGILADEMGKTIQAISLMLANRPHAKDKQQCSAWTAAEAGMEFPTLGNADTAPRRGGTLVICPLIALTQWRAEIERFVEDGGLSVVTYHGADRAKGTRGLADADVVLTTYAVVQADYRRMVAKRKVKCPDCGKALYPDKLFLHRKYFCGEGAERTAAQAKTQRKKGGPKGGAKGDTKKDGKGAAGGSTKGKGGAKGSGAGSLTTVLPPKKGAKAAEEAGGGAANPKGRAGKKGKAKANAESDEEAVATDMSDGSVESGDESDAPQQRQKKPRGKPNAKAGSKAKAKQTVVEVESSDSDDGAATATKAKGKAAASKGRGKKAITEDVTDSDDAPVASKAAAGKGKGKAAATKGKGKADEVTVLDVESSDDSAFEAPVQKKQKTATGKAAAAKGKGKGKESDDDDVSDAGKGGGVTRAVGPLSALHCVSWFRIILDEAHVIKDRSTGTAKAVFALCSLNKLCLTGTPLQNRVSELYSPIRFLRMDPFAYYVCKAKGCACKSLHYRFGPEGRKCEECGHNPMTHSCTFNRLVLNPIMRAGYIGEGRRAFITLKSEVLDKILLRRTKATRSDDIALPPRVVRVRRYRLSEKEEDFYQALYTQSQAQFDDYVNTGVVLNNYAHIFDILIRLRQALDHPYLAAETGECGVCREQPEQPVTAECGHPFCRSCVVDLMTTAMEGVAMECPTCSKPLTVDLNADEGGRSKGKAVGTLRMRNVQKKSIINKIDLAKFQTSTKLEALMQELHEMQQHDPSAKAIVFSQFVNMLDLLEFRIKRGGVQCVKLSGHMNVGARDVVLEAFKEDPDVKVLLISLKAGGVALNLTVASYCFLMDPWWNPAAEMQAIDRTHRMGQFKPIHAVRFIIEDTIEERILKLQDKKRLVFDSTVGGDAGSLARLTVDDLRFLFSPGGCGRS
ncbi:P-loop containing nucleoside triphosphate hydrolase protein [Tribonema minus]|uniref:P-loop containing nucleoside triphosphate hydrolase protein n=1 Tax=Tribonema minus TaxID=303371 RepID=A0A836CRA2_9STRA|nr:P-loop containing nucleoside triphosphate hydrolase protein [Tribonema minus]